MDLSMYSIFTNRCSWTGEFYYCSLGSHKELHALINKNPGAILLPSLLCCWTNHLHRHGKLFLKSSMRFQNFRITSSSSPTGMTVSFILTLDWQPDCTIMCDGTASSYIVLFFQEKNAEWKLQSLYNFH